MVVDGVALELRLQAVVEVELDDEDDVGGNDAVDHESWVREVAVRLRHEVLVRLSLPQAVAEVRLEQ